MPTQENPTVDPSVERIVQAAKENTDQDLDASDFASVVDNAETIPDRAKRVLETRTEWQRLLTTIQREKGEHSEVATDGAAKLAEVESAIAAHIEAIEEPAAPVDPDSPEGKIHAVTQKVSGFFAPVANAIQAGWGRIEPYIKPIGAAIKNGMEWLKSIMQPIVQSIGPKALGLLGIRVPEWLRPEPKLLEQLRDAFMKKEMSIILEEGEDYRTRLGRIEQTYIDAFSKEKTSLSRAQFLEKIVDVAQTLEPGVTDVSMSTIETAAGRVLNEETRQAADAAAPAAPAPTPGPTPAPAAPPAAPAS